MKFKFKYRDGVIKKICMWRAASERAKFHSLIWSGKLKFSHRKANLDFDIISFSGIKDLEEQVLSILSFLVNVGRPRVWTIYSDGSHERKERDLLLNMFDFLQVKEWNDNETFNNNKYLQRYLEVCHLSKKLHAIIGHNFKRQTVYADSDIVFYPNASPYFSSSFLQQDLWFIADTNWGSITKVKEIYPLNSGLMILNKDFNYEDVFEYLESLNNHYEYFSEQSSFNYSLKKQHAQLLDPRQFIVCTDDQFEFAMRFDKDRIAMRHYVNPVRHKMWQKGWRWHLSNENYEVG